MLPRLLTDRWAQGFLASLECIVNGGEQTALVFGESSNQRQVVRCVICAKDAAAERVGMLDHTTQLVQQRLRFHELEFTVNPLLVQSRAGYEHDG